jgi:enamine deaminase RidA (YjgF/YER057c/UK114 family)
MGGRVSILPAGVRVYVAGQAEAAPTLRGATRKTLDKLRATLGHLGLNDSHVVQLKAFLKPMAGADEVRDEVARFFGDRPAPPLVLVEWESTLPIEIELVAWGGPNRGGEAVEYLTPPGMTASPVFSRVARVNAPRTIYTAGLYAPAAGDVKAEAQGLFAELERVVRLAGGDLKHLVKGTYYVTSPESNRAFDEVRPRYYDPRRPPAASKARVAGVGRDGRTLTLDMIAVPVEP